MKKLSRRKIADYAASQIMAGQTDSVMREVAGYLIESRRTREAELIVRTIEDELAGKGLVVADATSATKLDASLKSAIKDILQAKDLHLRETIDTDVIGGLKLDAPGKKLDATIKTRINNLQKAKI